MGDFAQWKSIHVSSRRLFNISLLNVHSVLIPKYYLSARNLQKLVEKSFYLMKH